MLGARVHSYAGVIRASLFCAQEAHARGEALQGGLARHGPPSAGPPPQPLSGRDGETARLRDMHQQQSQQVILAACLPAAAVSAKRW